LGLRKFFLVCRGTRQGSPLSPLIFALFLEPLAIALRECKQIRGVDMGQEEHKIFLYADDILLISSNPEQAVPAISSIIDSFSVISGYTINWSKSEVMPISKLCPPVTRSSWQFKWMPEGLTYLGIKLTPGLDNIMQVNISPVIENIRPLLQNWAKINLSLLGRINLVKMIIAPKLQYLLHMLPIAVPHNLLKLYNTCVEGFVWAGKKPSFNRSKLYAPKDNGGLALSKMVWYHYAFSLSQLVKIYNSLMEKPSWVAIEESLVMKDGDVSLILKNVVFNDAEMYKRHVAVRNSGRSKRVHTEISHFIGLTVTGEFVYTPWKLHHVPVFWVNSD
uniref:Reverse transcriptase domain-containing protein n=1 Tax=Oreochromis aureus TaxID=47969 RepID=A0AAZ1XL60_OREAU